MANKVLKSTILETVDNQLQIDDPKCTRLTFERLVASGYTEKEAKEMIGAVLLEDIYYILKDKQKFDEKKYSEKLNSLQGKYETADKTNIVSSTSEGSIQGILEQIEYNTGTFPKEILLQIIQRREEAIPLLIDILKKVRDNPEKYRNESHYFGNIYAAYLLAQFRVKEAFPVFVEILRLPNEMPHDLFGDAICEAASRILASICGDDIKPIKDLIENNEIDKFVRGQAVEALAILALNGMLERDEVIGYYKDILNEVVKVNNPLVMAELICSCNDIFPGELYDDIKMAYEKELVDDTVINMKSIGFSLTMGKDNVLASSRNNVHLQFIDDTIDELEHWACFHRNKGYSDHKAFTERSLNNTQTVIKEFKVGRNDPCPCGSGKKYKKCCGK